MAGCLESSPSTCNGSPCDPDGQGRPPEGAEPIPAPFLQLEGCSGLILAVPVPEDRAVPIVPTDAFRIVGDLPTLADAGIELLRCRRVVVETQVHQSVGLLFSYVDVRPRNATWQEGAASGYAVDVLATNGDVARALRDAGMRAESGRLQRVVVPLASQWIQETWQFQTATKSYSVDALHNEERGSQLHGGGEFDRHAWSGRNPFNRTDIHHKDVFTEYLGLVAGHLSASGDTPFRELLGGSEGPYNGQAVHELQWTVRPTPRVFAIQSGGTP